MEALAFCDLGQDLVVLAGSVEPCFELGGWDVREVAVEARGVVPVHPSEGRELDLFDGLPGPGAGGSADQLGFLVAVHRLGQRVVERVADRSDRGVAPISANRSP